MESTVFENYVKERGFTEADIPEELTEIHTKYSELRSSLEGIDFNEKIARKLGEGTPDFEKKVYFETAKKEGLLVLDLCEHGALIGKDDDCENEYMKGRDGRREAVESFLEEARAIEDACYMDFKEVDKGISILKEIWDQL